VHDALLARCAIEKGDAELEAQFLRSSSIIACASGSRYGSAN
jgi:hypothetical protein